MQAITNGEGIYEYMGYVELEGMPILERRSYFLDIPNLDVNNIQFADHSFYYTADLKVTSKIILPNVLSEDVPHLQTLIQDLSINL